MPAVKKVTSSAELNEFLKIRNDVVVTNAQKWHNGPTAVWPALQEDFFSLVIVDEAHHLPADQWKQIVDKFRGHARVVFLLPRHSELTRETFVMTLGNLLGLHINCLVKML